MTTGADVKPRIGVSACLLGKNVRLNGGHCRQPFLTNVLARHVEFVPVCPEVGMGLPVPRPAMRLKKTASGPRLVVSKTGEDLTEQAERYNTEAMETLAAERLNGFVLKKDSPTCGLMRVKEYSEKGMPERTGTGIFARALQEQFPSLPIEEEGRLNDPLLRENFLIRTFTHARWKHLLSADPTPRGLVAFHTMHKMTVLAADPEGYRQLGPLVAQAGSADWHELTAAYEERLMAALARPPSPGRHVNALQHLLGFLKDELTGEQKARINEQLDLYRQGLVPRAVPLALIRYLLDHHSGNAWAREQTYLEPYSVGLGSGAVA